MKLRILIAAARHDGGWLAACSKPAADQGTDRQIRLAEPPSADSAVVSTLEAPNALKPVLVRRPAPAPTRPAAQPSPVVDLAVPAPHVTSSMAASVVETSALPELAAAPEAPALGFGGSIGHGLGAVELPAAAPQSLAGAGGGNRGPMILIRGGMGGIDDKCDLRGQHRPGIAINRIAPAFGPRGGIR